MKNNIFSWIMIFLGLCLLGAGIANILGYINFEIIDTNPPNVLYTFPTSASYRPDELTEYVAYVQDKESKITSVTYTDDLVSVNLEIVPYTQIEHQLNITSPTGTQCKYPDVNIDGIIDVTDVNLVSDHYGEYVDASNDKYDINNDGYIGTDDISITASFVYTVSVKADVTEVYPEGNYAFTIVAIDEYGNLREYTGWFEVISDYTTLKGTWKINDMIVDDGTIINDLLEDEIKLSFIKSSTESIPDSDITVIARVGEQTYALDYLGNGKWERTIKLTKTYTTITLEAYTNTNEINKITVTVILKTQQYPSYGLLLSIIGIALIVSSVVYMKK